MYINDLYDEDVLYGPELLENKVVGIISGCYCPPHKGHFFSWYNACKDLNLDILFISSVNLPAIKKTKYGYKKNFLSRHGIPIEFTEWVISQWASHLTNADNKPVTVIFSQSPSYKISNDFKQLYIISYGEGKSTNKSENEIEKIKWIENLDKLRKGDFSEPDISTWGKKHKIKQAKNNESNIYPVYRISNKNYWRDITGEGSDSPSATKFTKCLKTTKFFLLSGVDRRSECFSYLPDFMSDEDKYAYIDKIMNEYYTDTVYDECIAEYPDESELCNKYNFKTVGGNIQGQNIRMKRKSTRRKNTKRKNTKRKNTKRKNTK